MEQPLKKVCQKCTRHNYAKLLYCLHCGVQLPREPEPVQTVIPNTEGYCYKCNYQNYPKLSHCFNCGVKLEPPKQVQLVEPKPNPGGHQDDQEKAR